MFEGNGPGVGGGKNVAIIETLLSGGTYFSIVEIFANEEE